MRECRALLIQYARVEAVMPIIAEGGKTAKAA